MVHNQIVRRPGPGMSARAMHDINVIGSLQLLAALREGPDRPHDRGPRLGGHLRVGARGAAVLRRGDGAAVPAAHALPARRGRDRELLRDLLAPPPGRGLHDAALPARDRPVAGHAGHALPLAARVCPPTWASTRASSWSTRRTALDALVAAVRQPGARRRERGGPGHDRPDPHDPHGGPARRCPLAGPLFGARHRRARRAGLRRLSTDFRRLLRYGRGGGHHPAASRRWASRPRYTTSTPSGLADGRARVTRRAWADEPQSTRDGAAAPAQTRAAGPARARRLWPRVVHAAAARGAGRAASSCPRPGRAAPRRCRGDARAGAGAGRAPARGRLHRGRVGLRRGVRARPSSRCSTSSTTAGGGWRPRA